ncbi:MAG: hypothetical protein MZV70_49975 [Desulfobacterales bacterium]|nr:hypothetical protein [Desulfobacterales bacterium]
MPQQLSTSAPESCVLTRQALLRLPRLERSSGMPDLKPHQNASIRSPSAAHRPPLARASTVGCAQGPDDGMPAVRKTVQGHVNRYVADVLPRGHREIAGAWPTSCRSSVCRWKRSWSARFENVPQIEGARRNGKIPFAPRCGFDWTPADATRQAIPCISSAEAAATEKPSAAWRARRCL